MAAAKIKGEAGQIETFIGLQIPPGASQAVDLDSGLPVPFTWQDGRLILETSLPVDGIWVVKII